MVDYLSSRPKRAGYQVSTKHGSGPTDCGVDIEWDYSPAILGVRANDQLVSRWVEAQRRRGREPHPRGVVSEILAASTDFGNVSYRVPSIHPLIKIANEDQALHPVSSRQPSEPERATAVQSTVHTAGLTRAGLPDRH